MKEKVLIIGYVWPESRSSAAGQNMMGLIHFFLDNHYHVTFASAAAHSIHSDNLSSLGVDVLDIALNCSSFNNLVKDLSPSITVFDRYMTEEQFSWRVRQSCPGCLHVLNTEDLHSLREHRHQQQKNDNLHALPYPNGDLAKREIASILRSDLTLVLSRFEHDLLQEQYKVPASQLHYLPLLQPNSNIPSMTFSERQHFVTIGNFRHQPNWDAVLQLRQTLWPIIRKALPHSELHVYGAYPPPKATQLHQPKLGFLVKGWAEDSDIVVSQGRVLLAPLRFGAGIKGKLLTAMRNQTPSVTTPIGQEGFTTTIPWPGVIAQNNDEFCRAAIALYQDETLWQESANRCASHIDYLHNDTHQALASLQTRLRALSQDITAFRQQHFLQGLLWHHTLKSTQYMSQWIEAKNRISG